LGYAELKTTMFERKEALRSKKPDGVRQEIWGILLAYNLVRLMILEAADEAGLPPTRISFKNSLHLSYKRNPGRTSSTGGDHKGNDDK